VVGGSVAGTVVDVGDGNVVAAIVDAAAATVVTVVKVVEVASVVEAEPTDDPELEQLEMSTKVTVSPNTLSKR
jgi:hypothetical protein